MSDNSRIAKEFIGEVSPKIGRKILLVAVIVVLGIFISWEYVLILLLIYLLFRVMISKDTLKGKVLSFLKSATTLVLFFLAVRFLGKWGVGAVLLAIAVYFIWKGWPLIMRGVRTGEKMAFGKTLDKENWIDKRPKLKLRR